MPTYHSTGVHTALSISDMALSTTPEADICNTAKAKRNIRMAELAIAKGFPLNEWPLSINGRSFLEFLGAEKDMPFFLVHVNGEKVHRKLSEAHIQRSECGAEIERKDSPVDVSKAEREISSFTNSSTLPEFDSPFTETYDVNTKFVCTKHEQGTGEPFQNQNSSDTMLQKSQQTRQSHPTDSSTLNVISPAYPNNSVKKLPTQDDPEDSSQALILTVSLDPKSRVWHQARDPTAFDIKIEVFYNGDFAACRLVTSKSRISAKGNLTRHFSGKRIHRMAEHAWKVNFKAEESTLKGKETVFKRWHAIGRILREESDLRGNDTFSKRSPTGEYLANLSGIDIPEALKHVVTKSNRRMGIIDVVMSLGRGRKFTSNSHYLAQPKRLPVPDSSVKQNTISPEHSRSACKGVENLSRRNLTPSRNLRLPDLTIDPATAWARAISLKFNRKSESRSDHISTKAEKSINSNENFSSTIVSSSTYDVMDRSIDGHPFGREKLVNQSKMQVNKSSRPMLSKKYYSRKRSVQGSGRTEGSPPSNNSLNTYDLAGGDDSLLEQCDEKENPVSKIPRSRKRPFDDLFAESRRLSGSCMCCPQIRRSRTVPWKSPHISDGEANVISSTTSTKENFNDLLRRSLRSGPSKNYREAQSSSSTTSELHTSANYLESQLTNDPTSNDSNFERHETSNRAPDMSDGAVASYAEAGPYPDTGSLRSIKQEKNGEFEEDSILVGIRYVLI